MSIFDGAGMQMMVANMIKMAAPDLIEKVEEFTKTVLAVKAQLDRIEQQQNQILARLGATTENDSGRIGKEIERIGGPNGQIGSATGTSG